MKYVNQSILLSVFVVALLGTDAFADQVITDDLVVIGDGVCIGSNCSEGLGFGFSTLILDESDPTIRFRDTSVSANFPTTDWDVGVDSSTGVFAIRNVDTGSSVFAISANGSGVAIGAGATLTDDVVSMGGLRIANVADGIADTDAITLGQLNAAIATLPAELLAANTEYASVNAENIRRLDQLSDEVSSVGAIGSALSALQVNPRADGDHLFSFGLGSYEGTTALALGSFHYFAENKVFVNTGISAATNGIGGTAFRLGMTFGG